MLHVLLATIGALAVLASVAVKFAMLSADVVADDSAGADDAYDAFPLRRPARGVRPHRRVRGATRTGGAARCKAARAGVLARAVAD